MPVLCVHHFLSLFLLMHNQVMRTIFCPRLPATPTLKVKTDDSFQFARAIKRLRSAIEALGDSTGGGGGSGGDGDGDGPEADAAEERSSALSHERKVAVIEIMKEAFKSYHLAWARSSIEPAFKVRVRVDDVGKWGSTLHQIDVGKTAHCAVC